MPTPKPIRSLCSLRALAIALPAVLVMLVSTAAAQDTLRERVDAHVGPYIDAKVLNSAVVVVFQQGNALVAGYGTVGGAAPDGNTVYEIGSVSKVFTGIILADAVTRGRVALDTPVNDLLPDGVVLQQKGDDPVQLAQLSTHTSGLPRMPFNFSQPDANDPYEGYTVELLYEFLAKYKASRTPGSRMLYSNLGVAILGHALSLEAGVSYEELLQSRIAGPLGMKSTATASTPDMQKRLAPGHFGDGTPTSSWDFLVFAPAGAIRSTGNDMLRFIEAQLGPPEGETGEAIELAWTMQQEPLSAENFAMCLGWHMARDGSTRWHNGETGGYHSALYVNRMIEVGVMVLSNTATGEVDRLAETLIQVLAGANLPPREFQSTDTVDVPVEVMQRYVGTYQLMPGMDFTVTVENGHLMVGLTGQAAYRVFPRSETEWFYKVVDATITFQLDESGNCTALELFQNGVRQPAKKTN